VPDDAGSQLRAMLVEELDALKAPLLRRAESATRSM
jgi:hypothetical protein